MTGNGRSRSACAATASRRTSCRPSACRCSSAVTSPSTKSASRARRRRSCRTPSGSGASAAIPRCRQDDTLNGQADSDRRRAAARPSTSTRSSRPTEIDLLVPFAVSTDRQLRQHAVRRRPIEAGRHRRTGRIGSRHRQPPADLHDYVYPSLRLRVASARTPLSAAASALRSSFSPSPSPSFSPSLSSTCLICFFLSFTLCAFSSSSPRHRREPLAPPVGWRWS